MLASRLQLVKWTVPAFALILGLLWYKRRRADRADPGGMPEGKSRHNRHSESSKASLNLSDSGIHTDDTFTSSSSVPIKCEPLACSPKKVSESLTIPARKPVAELVSIKSAAPSSVSSDDQAWYKDVEMTIDTQNLPALTTRNGSASPNRQSVLEIKSKKMQVSAESQQFISKSRSESSFDAAKTVRSELTQQILDNQDKPSRAIVETKMQDGAASERDSANHSPISGVLDGSVSDEARSEGSSDSGKGGSINGNLKAGPSVYEFVLPQILIGRLIGRHGNFLHSIKAKGQVNILIKRHPETNKMKVCAIEGTTQGIDVALEMIRQKFPLNKYPNVTLEQVSFLKKPEQGPWVPEVMQLKLIEGVNNDVTVISILKPNHLFLHLPTHPSYPSLRILDQHMTQLYNTTTDAPPVPEQLQKGNIFVAKWYDRWVRVYIQKPDPDGEKNLVRLIDHGGFGIFKNSEMRKIRYDYLTLPFQAIEVFLANIRPKHGEWQQEAYDLVAQICQGVVAQAQIQGYVDRDTHVNLYLNIQKHGVISLAEELVARGFAEPVQLEEVATEVQ